MSLSLAPATVRINPEATQQFTPSGGTGPYTYEVLGGGVGGSIDAAGLYTAPDDVGSDTIRVTDSLSATAEAVVLVDPILSLIPSSRAIGPGNNAPFAGTGGTEPYTYSVVAGGAGGTIDTDGIYTAPATVNEDPAKGYDTIRVTDSVGQIAEATALVCTAPQLVADILRAELGLQADRVYLWDQKINAPTDKGLFIAVGVLLCKPFGNTRREASAGSGLNSEQSVNMFATLTLDVISQGPAARDRKEEVIMALNSVYSEQQQELNAFKIAQISSSFVNLSQIDGSAIPYRFSISVNIQYMVKKTRSAPFYNDFEEPAVLTEWMEES